MSFIRELYDLLPYCCMREGFTPRKDLLLFPKQEVNEQVINIILPVLSFFHIKTHCSLKVTDTEMSIFKSKDVDIIGSLVIFISHNAVMNTCWIVFMY